MAQQFLDLVIGISIGEKTSHGTNAEVSVNPRIQNHHQVRSGFYGNAGYLPGTGNDGNQGIGSVLY